MQALAVDAHAIHFIDDSVDATLQITHENSRGGTYHLPLGVSCYALTMYVHAGVTVTLEEPEDTSQSYARTVEIVLLEGAQVTYRSSCTANLDVTRYQFFKIQVGAGASFTAHAWNAGGAVHHTAYRCELTGAGASVTYVGRMYAQGAQKHTLSFMQIHQAPDTKSSVELKTVADGTSVCKYEGTIAIEKQAVRSEAHQEHKTLLLSNTAQVRSVPNLEVLTHQVQCGHGSAMAHLDDDHLFYLASRGIVSSCAKQMIIDGFLY